MPLEAVAGEDGPAAVVTPLAGRRTPVILPRMHSTPLGRALVAVARDIVVQVPASMSGSCTKVLG